MADDDDDDDDDKAKVDDWDSLRNKARRLLTHCAGYRRWFGTRLRRRQSLYVMASVGTVVTTAVTALAGKHTASFNSVIAELIPVVGTMLSGFLASLLWWGQTNMRALIRAQQEASDVTNQVIDWVKENQSHVDDSRQHHDKQVRSSFRTLRDQVKSSLEGVAMRVDTSIADEILRQGQPAQGAKGSHAT